MVCAQTHGANQVIVFEVSQNRFLKSLLIMTDQCDMSPITSTNSFHYILNIHLDSINTTARKVAM